MTFKTKWRKRYLSTRKGSSEYHPPIASSKSTYEQSDTLSKASSKRDYIL